MTKINNNNRVSRPKKKAARSQGPQVRQQRKQPFRSTSITSSNAHSMVVRHRELIESINGASVGTPKRILQFQPGSLPWLKALSSRFERYELLSAEIEVVSGNGANSAGIYSLSLDYDVTDPDPIDMYAMMNGGNSVSASIWKDSKLKVNVADILPRQKLTSPGFNPTGTDAKFYDAFSAFFLVGPTSYFQIYVNYVVRLTVPQISNAPNGTVTSSVAISKVGTESCPSTLARSDPDDMLPVKIAIPSAVELPTAIAGAQALLVPPNSNILMAVESEIDAPDASAHINAKTNNITLYSTVAEAKNATDDVISEVFRVVTGDVWGAIQYYATSAAQTMTAQQVVMALLSAAS